MSRFYEALRATYTTPPAATPKPRNSETQPQAALLSLADGVDDVIAASLRPRVTEAPIVADETGSFVPAAGQTEATSISPAEEPEASPIAVAVDRTAKVILNSASPIVMEQYRRLRTKMMQQHAVRPFRSVLVTSPGAQEGKTVTTLNLAISFSMLPNYRVLVIDGDLRRRNLSQALGVRDQPGFSNLLDGSAKLAQVVHACTDFPFFAISAGNSETPPTELLHPPQAPWHIREITQRFDLVLIDSCPVNLIADTQLLAGYTDAILLVTRAFATARAELEKAARDLRPFRIIGAVLNGGTRTQLYGRKNVYY
jgi:capsular exopolysaccharide synthesis family protein